MYDNKYLVYDNKYLKYYNKYLKYKKKYLNLKKLYFASSNSKLYTGGSNNTKNRFYNILERYMPDVLGPYSSYNYITSITIPFDCLMDEVIKRCDNRINKVTICKLIKFIGNCFEYIWFFKYKEFDSTIVYENDGAYKINKDISDIFLLFFDGLHDKNIKPFIFLSLFIKVLVSIRTKIEEVYNIKPKKLTIDLYKNNTNLKSFYNINIKLWLEKGYPIIINQNTKKNYLDNEFLKMIKVHSNEIRNKSTFSLLLPYNTIDKAFNKIKEYCLSKLVNLLFVLDIIIDVYNIIYIDKDLKRDFEIKVEDEIKKFIKNDRIIQFNKLI